ncbi:MAG: hypothetical protein ACTSWN_03490 [Promethearchaeota archaeon]
MIKWRPNPLRNKIVVALLRRKGEISDDELIRLMQKNDQSITPQMIQKELMSLEIEGVLLISQMTKTKKRVKLINEDIFNPDLLLRRR